MEKEIKPWPEVEEEIINIGSRAETETGRLLSNFAEAPFDLDGEHYASVESFWQSLKFPEEDDIERQKIKWRWTREQVTQMTDREAKKAGRWANKRLRNLGINYVTYFGDKIEIGSLRHQELMKSALLAKFEQNPGALKALLGTGEKKITHILKNPEGEVLPDSKTIPREIFTRFLMDLRDEFREKEEEE